MKIETLRLSKELFSHYEQREPVKYYFGLLAYYALAQTAVLDNDDALLQKCKDYLAQYPDNFEHPRYNFESYRVGGNGAAWLLMKGYTPEAAEKITHYAELTLAAPQSPEGIIRMPGEGNEYKVFADAISCTVPFMTFAGVGLGEEKYLDYAAEQCLMIYDVLFDESCGLIHQARGFLADKTKLSEDHWSRGNGWGILGLAELVRYLPKTSKYYEKVKSYFVNHMHALLKYQTERGLWRQEITVPYAWYESSGTGIILYAMGIGIRLGLLDKETFLPALRLGVWGLGRYCIDTTFSTHKSCPGCLCPGPDSIKGTIDAYLTERMPRVNEHHSYSALMLALVEAYRNGITEVEIFERDIMDSSW